jgi:hypothetical protein
MPNKANLRRWVAALRSGAYQQGQSFMRTKDNKYCCLGVAMDLALANGVVCDNIDWGKTSVTPKEVNDWFGTERSVGGLNKEIKLPDGGVYSPSNLNDGGTSFADIADAIERTYELLEA